MKKTLTLLAFLGLFSFAIPGCGEAPETIEPASEDDGSMSDAEYEQYQQQMQGGGSSRPGN